MKQKEHNALQPNHFVPLLDVPSHFLGIYRNVQNPRLKTDP